MPAHEEIAEQEKECAVCIRREVNHSPLTFKLIKVNIKSFYKNGYRLWRSFCDHLGKGQTKTEII